MLACWQLRIQTAACLQRATMINKQSTRHVHHRNVVFSTRDQSAQARARTHHMTRIYTDFAGECQRDGIAATCSICAPMQQAFCAGALRTSGGLRASPPAQGTFRNLAPHEAHNIIQITCAQAFHRYRIEFTYCTAASAV